MTTDEFILHETAKFFKAFSQPDRLRILQMLANGELCQCDLVERINKSQSTLSTHLRRLVEQGILQVRQDGQRRLYKISDSVVKEIITKAQTMITKTIQTKAAHFEHKSATRSRT